MKTLLCILCIFPSISFAQNCDKTVSPSETLYYQINKVLVSPTDSFGRLNILIYKDIISKNKFGEAQSALEKYQFLKTKSETKNMFKLFNVVSSSNSNVEKVEVDHKNENLDGQKAKLIALIDNSIQHSNSEDKNILYLQNKDGEVSVIDFRLPMSANPVYSSSKEGEARSFSYESSGYNVIAPLPINKSIADALSKNNYEIEECNKSVYTQVTTKDLKIGDLIIGKITVSNGTSK